MQIFRKNIINFFIRIWRLLNFIRVLVMNLFFISLILICSIYLIHNISNTRNSYFKGGALLLDITGTIVDKPSVSNRLHTIIHHLFNINLGQQQENSLFDIVNAIRQAKNDYNITGIVLDLKNFTGSDQPSMQYIGKALNEFKNTGKPVIAIGDDYNQWQYYLASFSDKIWLSHHGAVDLHGFTNNKLYYKTLLDKLKVTTHIFRVGMYKSAVEPFIRDDMSPEARKADSIWINELWQNYLYTIAINRRINTLQVFPGSQEILNSLYKVDGNTAKYALINKLVDILGSRAEMEKSLSDQFGWDNENKKYRAISIYDYVIKKNPKEGDEIAVIFINGMIIDGKEISGNIGSDTVISQIREARLNPKIKAIILRINSSGGSIRASEVIREELMAVRTMGKPIIVSMGGVAASGGYWISTPANYIIANQSTLTGSIGIFGIINTIESSLDYLGVHTDGVSTSSLADVTITKTLPSEISKIMKLRVKNGYDHFITLVSQSRGKSKDQINCIAQGRVWTGQDAKDNGLVDSLGDFDDAVIKAVEAAKLKKWYVNYYQDKSNLFNVIVNNISFSISTIILNLIQKYLSMYIIASNQYTNLDSNNLIAFTFNDPQNCYALCLSCTNMY